MTPCPLTHLDQLFDYLDAPRRFPDLARHVAGCSRCHAWVTRQREQGHALRALARRPAPGPLRARILDAARDAALDVLARCLQELHAHCVGHEAPTARAGCGMDGMGGGAVRAVAGRPWEDVGAHVRALERRLGGLGLVLGLGHLPRQAPAPARARRQAPRLLGDLERVLELARRVRMTEAPRRGPGPCAPATRPDRDRERQRPLGAGADPPA